MLRDAAGVVRMIMDMRGKIFDPVNEILSSNVHLKKRSQNFVWLLDFPITINKC